MNRVELLKLYEDYELGHINAEIGCLEDDKKELELTPDQLRELAEIREKLEFLYSLRETKKRT